MGFNVINSTATPVTDAAATNNIVWVLIPAPMVGQIVRLIVAETSGTVDGTATLIDIFNCAQAGYAQWLATQNGTPTPAPAATVAAQYQVIPTQTLPGSSSVLAVFPLQFFANADGPDNVQRANTGLYVRINTQEATSKTFTITISVETEQ